MSTDSWLELHRPENLALNDLHSTMLELPSHIPKRLHRCGKVFNSAMIVGSALGMDESVAALGGILDGLDTLPDDIPHLFLEEDLKETISAVSAIRIELENAIDNEGRAQGPKGVQLLKDQSLRKDADGYIYTVTGHMFLGELLQHLKTLFNFLQYALNYKLVVEKESS